MRPRLSNLHDLTIRNDPDKTHTLWITVSNMASSESWNGDMACVIGHQQTLACWPSTNLHNLQQARTHRYAT